jgi:prefoldin subunit 5
MNIDPGQKDKDIAVLDEMHKRYTALKQKADEELEELNNTAEEDRDETDLDELEANCNTLEEIVDSLSKAHDELVSL